MAIYRSLASGVKALFHRERRNQEIKEELQGYQEAAVDEKMRRGMTREEALRATNRGDRHDGDGAAQGLVGGVGVWR